MLTLIRYLRNSAHRSEFNRLGARLAKIELLATRLAKRADKPNRKARRPAA